MFTKVRLSVLRAAKHVKGAIVIHPETGGWSWRVGGEPVHTARGEVKIYRTLDALIRDAAEILGEGPLEIRNGV